jgi:hypothetical protein
LVDALIVAFRDRLEANTWMTPETKAKALDKLSTINVKVGYPDRWKSYGAVTIEGSYAESVLSATNAETRRTLDQIGRPVDRDDWTLRGFGPVPPQTINALYSPQDNEIVFPAAILQPPFFDYRADPVGFLVDPGPPVPLPHVPLDPPGVLSNQHVSRQGLDALIMLELLAPVVGFGRIGQDPEDHQRVEQGVLFVIDEHLLSASHHEFGVGEQPGVRYLHPHVVRVHVAGAFP